ncbi:hypothetical protein R1flu_020519 [Riccia fluitans]|uniref:Uncharacterized protein n=1 Tax=Riccia fluitans TaxID=41844 RepID=A0ABD1ZND4_9MARC
MATYRKGLSLTPLQEKSERSRVNTRQAARSEQDFEEKPDVADDANDEKGDANDRRASYNRRWSSPAEINVVLKG